MAARSTSSKPPAVAAGRHGPLVLTEGIGVNAIARLAIGDDGLLRAVQIVQAAYDDPFAACAKGAD